MNDSTDTEILERPAHDSRRKPSAVPGMKFGEWTLVQYIAGAKTPKRTDAYWLCKCSCGAQRKVRATNLHDSSSKSCGHVMLERWND